jgi:uncharacterized protein (TIGR03083 family)
MTATTTAALPATGKRTPAWDRPTAARLMATEYDRLITLLRDLDDADWKASTPCPAWDVHAIACHVLGMAEMSASMPEQMRQMRQAKKAGGLFIDALTSLQVAKHVDKPAADVVRLLTDVAPKAARKRAGTPGVMRRMPMKDQPIDETGSQTETWTLGYLVDVILTRDTWMHRSDIAVATGRSMELTPGHDGVIVADVAKEWAMRHGRSCTLVLTGPVGGEWQFAGGGERVEADAVEFCRVLAGRGQASGLLATRVPF